MHNDFLHKLTQEGRGKFFKAGVLADNIHNLFCVYRGFLRFGKLCPQSGGFQILFLYGIPALAPSSFCSISSFIKRASCFAA